jgi:Nicotinate phosphoribosyltransferase (NAPRTase) N-terminal domain
VDQHDLVPPPRGLLTDLYELTMAASYLRRGMDDLATFSLFVRHLPPARGFLVAAGLEDCLAFLEDFHFHDHELTYLRPAPDVAGDHACPDRRCHARKTDESPGLRGSRDGETGGRKANGTPADEPHGKPSGRPGSGIQGVRPVRAKYQALIR